MEGCQVAVEYLPAIFTITYISEYVLFYRICLSCGEKEMI